MNKLLVALVTSAFALVSASALAADGDTRPLPKNQADDSSLSQADGSAPPVDSAAKKTKERKAKAPWKQDELEALAAERAKKRAHDSELWRTGGFGPAGGRVEKMSQKQREAEERTAKRQAEIDAKQKAGPPDEKAKPPLNKP